MDSKALDAERLAALLRQIVLNDDVGVFASAIESLSPRAPNFEKWREDVLDALGVKD